MFVGKPDLNQSFYSGNYTLQVADWEYVLRSLITHSQNVWLRSSIEFAPNIPNDIRGHIERIKGELINEGIIRTWELETGEQAIATTTERIISIQEQRELAHILKDEQKQTPVLGPETTSVDEIAKNVDIQRDLWNFGLANYCGNSNVVFNTADSQFQSLLGSNDISKFNIDSEFAIRIFKKFGIDGLWKLDAAQIIQFQESSVFYRREIEDSLKNKIHVDDADMDDIIRGLSENYEIAVSKLVDKGSTKSFATRAASEIVFNVVESIVPLASFLPLSKDFFSWLRSRNRTGFVLHMYELRKLMKET